jgi:hypothetical protein
MKDFAGTMKEKVELWHRTPGRDALGGVEAGDGGDWTLAGLIWAAAEPAGYGLEAGDDGDRPQRWQVTLRPCTVNVGDRIMRPLQWLEVKDVLADPARPDRVTVTAEVVR